MTIQFSEKTLKEVEWLLSRYPTKQAALLPVLRLLERDFGEVSEEGMMHVAKLLSIPPARVFGVFTFYTHYRRPGTGKYFIQVCSTLPCALRGSDKVCDALCENLGIKEGETTPDGMFTVKKVECLAGCDRATFVQVNDDEYANVTPDKVGAFVTALKRGGKDEERSRTVYSGMEVHKKGFLLEHVGNPESKTMNFYISKQGYEGARKALTMKPDEVIETVKQSGLRGRGGAGFSAGMKWSFVPKNSPKPKYLVINADESEPGTFKDRTLIHHNPHAIVEGIIIAAWAIQSNTAYIYIRGEFPQGAKILQQAVQEAYDKGFLGKNIFGTGFNLDLTVHRGAGAYICGEETGLLSSIEGNRGYPKIKPPFPAIEGLFRSPTVVNNVDTMANLPHILMKGAPWFKTMGTEKGPGNQIYGLSGHVKKPGLYELPTGTSLRELIYTHGGGILNDKKLKAVIPGGSSVPVLTASEIDVAMDYDALGAIGTRLGTGAIIVMDEETCMVNALWNLMRFYHHESCGQCTPCREGTGWLEKLTARLEQGRGQPGDVDLVLEVADQEMRWSKGRTICAFSDGAADPAVSFVKKFKDEFIAHVNEKRCPFLKTGKLAETTV